MSPVEKNAAVRSFMTLHVPCRFSYLRIIRQSVMDLCARAGFSEFKAAQMEMAVDEACANIIEHSYGGEVTDREEPQHPGIRVNLMQGADRIIVELLDRGKGFDLPKEEVLPPDKYLESNSERGLGTYIIKRFVDDLAYEHDTPAGHSLRLTKFVH
jgi:serine/threonine-protein kinase RsbW